MAHADSVLSTTLQHIQQLLACCENDGVYRG
jgi:hypothetical protein